MRKRRIITSLICGIMLFMGMFVEVDVRANEFEEKADYDEKDELQEISIIEELNINRNAYSKKIKKAYNIDEKTHNLVAVFEYDINGNLVARNNLYNPDGSYIRMEYEYDENDKIFKSTGYGYDGSINGWSEYQYDENGYNIKLTTYKSDGSVFGWKEYEYDNNGNITSEKGYEKQFESYERYRYCTYVYVNGNLIKEIYYNLDDSINSWIEYEYNEKGIIKETHYKSDGTISRCDEYDDNGNKIKETLYNSDGSINGTASFYWEIDYDSNENIIKEVGHTVSGIVSPWYEYEYDNNNMIKKIICNSFGKPQSIYEYTYDEEMNLIKEIHYPYNEENKITYCIEYDIKENPLYEVSYNSDGSVKNLKKWEYDDGDLRKVTSNGNIISLFEYYGDSEEISDNIAAIINENIENENGNSDNNGTGTDKNETKEISTDDSTPEITPEKSENQVPEITLEKPDESKQDSSQSASPAIEPVGSEFASYQGVDFYKDDSGDVRCYTNGVPVINDFKCDGEFTYFFQADGTAMKDRLTYHPDGEHVIYFDSEGHEVFSDFANVKKTIAGDEVDDYCFFDVFGYMYVDVVTYDKKGTVLYYANAYGVMEMGKWFQFSDKVTWADGRDGNEFKNQYGCANADGTLITNTQTIDWEGRSCYLQGNGVALY